jgi:hypothetical protein
MAYYNAGVVAVNSKVVGLAPEMNRPLSFLSLSNFEIGDRFPKF